MPAIQPVKGEAAREDEEEEEEEEGKEVEEEEEDEEVDSASDCSGVPMMFRRPGRSEVRASTPTSRNHRGEVQRDRSRSLHRAERAGGGIGFANEQTSRCGGKLSNSDLQGPKMNMIHIARDCDVIMGDFNVKMSHLDCQGLSAFKHDASRTVLMKMMENQDFCELWRTLNPTKSKEKKNMDVEAGNKAVAGVGLGKRNEQASDINSAKFKEDRIKAGRNGGGAENGKMADEMVDASVKAGGVGGGVDLRRSEDIRELVVGVEVEGETAFPMLQLLKAVEVACGRVLGGRSKETERSAFFKELETVMIDCDLIVGDFNVKMTCMDYQNVSCYKNDASRTMLQRLL
ncbi:hypothetical protein ABVT39_022482 [Epinephelus coioides]